MKNFMEQIMEAKSFEEARKLKGQAIQHYSDKILESFSPFSESEIIFVVAALSTIEATLKKMFPMEYAIGLKVRKELNIMTGVIKVPTESNEEGK